LLGKILEGDVAAVDYFFSNADDLLLYTLKIERVVFYFHQCQQILSLPQVGLLSNRKWRHIETQIPSPQSLIEYQQLTTTGTSLQEKLMK
jgi:hypothetical protein